MLKSFLLNWKYEAKPKLLENSKPQLLCRLLQHAKQNTLYYESVFSKANLSISDSGIDAVELLEHLPLLNKAIIRRNHQAITTRVAPVRRVYWNTSGGSTGEPIRILQDSLYLNCSRYITYRQKKLTGFRWGMPLIKIWGDENELFGMKKPYKDQLVGKLKNQHLLNSFRMNDKDKEHFLNEVSRLKPRLIVSYVQSIYELALYAEKHNIEPKNNAAIIVSAGTLYPFMKEKIEKVFESPVYNRYGSREVGSIAMSTPGDTCLHISEGCWIEVVDSDGNVLPAGQEGEIVATCLINYAMPLIRYQLGDRGILGFRRGDDGKNKVVIEQLRGRTVDLFTAQDGSKIDGEYFTHLMYFRDWVERFQFKQTELDSVQLKIVISHEPPEEDILEIKHKIRIVMGENCRILVSCVDTLPDPQSGKFRFVISEID